MPATTADKGAAVSHITDIAEREAAAAEAAAAAEHGAEGGDGLDGSTLPDEPAAADQPDQPPAPPQAFDVEALEREMQRHEKAVAKVLGDEWAAMEPCATCGSVGYTPIGAEPAPEMLDDPDVVLCPDCSGYGERLTPSLHPQYRTATCTPCGGTGYRDKAQVEAIEVAREYERQSQAAAAAGAQPPPPPAGNGAGGGSAVVHQGAPIWDAASSTWRNLDGSVHDFAAAAAA